MVLHTLECSKLEEGTARNQRKIDLPVALLSGTTNTNRGKARLIHAFIVVFHPMGLNQVK
jgi:hypothetical protein